MPAHPSHTDCTIFMSTHPQRCLMYDLLGVIALLSYTYANDLTKKGKPQESGLQPLAPSRPLVLQMIWKHF